MSQFHPNIDTLKQVAPGIIDLVKQAGGHNPLVDKVADAFGMLLNQHPDPAAPLLDAELKDALAGLHEAGQRARDSVKYQPPGSSDR